ncbi:MAG: glycosyltransferase family 8 protein [Selenomonadales bacterium]|nr:glycosyltransferase family 8 protein [Selenomonadales bacterium]
MKMISCTEKDMEHKNKISVNDAQIPDGYRRVVPIVFAVNAKYACYNAVTIQSIIEHCSENDFYRIYILQDGLGDAFVRRLEGIGSKNVVVRCVDVGDLINQKQVDLHIRAHFSKETYFRMVIPEIMPFYEKVIYLDCDLVVKDDVAALLNEDIGEHYIAGVRDCYAHMMDERLKKDLGIDGLGYVNAGVLVINMKQWLKHDLMTECFEMISRTPKEKLLYLDQDVLNTVCYNKIYHFDEVWNFQWHMLHCEKRYEEMLVPRAMRIKDDCKILHFSSQIKPWRQPELELSNEFWRYARKTDFYEEILYANMKEELEPEKLLAVLLKKKVLRAVMRKKLKKSFLYRLFK